LSHSGEVLLAVRGLSKRFAGVTALDGIDLDIVRGEICGVIGPNGSGKTTFINVVTGLVALTSGAIRFAGQEISGLPPHVIARKGIARTFQIPRVLPEMTCLENLMLGQHCRFSFDFGGTFLRPPFTHSRQEEAIRRRALGLLDFMGLGPAADRLGSELSWVEEQLVQLARALATEPRLLLLDEPTAGMGESESRAVREAILRTRDAGITTIVVAHDVKLIMDISDRVVCLSFGTKITEGRPDAVRHHPKVLEVYLGVD
jgi:branched-chain amino acid transport system ATP-binding protein